MKIIKITRKNIKPYAHIIDRSCIKSAGGKNRYGVLLKERSEGWRIGYLVVRDRVIRRLESHPDSLETFEPVKGRSVIALASRRNAGRPKVFSLDRPIVVKKGVWHDVAPLSKESEIKIFENIEVTVRYQRLKVPIKV